MVGSSEQEGGSVKRIAACSWARGRQALQGFPGELLSEWEAGAGGGELPGMGELSGHDLPLLGCTPGFCPSPAGLGRRFSSSAVLFCTGGRETLGVTTKISIP